MNEGKNPKSSSKGKGFGFADWGVVQKGAKFVVDMDQPFATKINEFGFLELSYNGQSSAAKQANQGLPKEAADRLFQRIMRTQYDGGNFWIGEQDAGLLRDFATAEYKAHVRKSCVKATGWHLHLCLIVLTRESTDAFLLRQLRRAATNREPVIRDFAKSELKHRNQTQKPTKRRSISTKS